MAIGSCACPRRTGRRRGQYVNFAKDPLSLDRRRGCAVLHYVQQMIIDASVEISPPRCVTSQRAAPFPISVPLTVVFRFHAVPMHFRCHLQHKVIDDVWVHHTHHILGVPQLVICGPVLADGRDISLDPRRHCSNFGHCPRARRLGLHRHCFPPHVKPTVRAEN
jgi:hypothetical protein